MCIRDSLICFGESFVQGFDGLTWKYDQDIERALTKDDSIIDRIRKIAETSKCGISFGFIERDKGTLYSSNMVIDSYGEIIDIFRRISCLLYTSPYAGNNLPWV